MKKLLTTTALLGSITLSLHAGTLNECEDAYKAGALDKAQTLCAKAAKEDSKSYMANYWLCLSYLNKGEYKKMLPVAQKLEKLAKTTEEYKASYNLQGLAYGYLGDKKQELKYALKDLETSKKIGNRDNIGVSLHNLGEYYRNNNNLDEAQKYYAEALEYKTDEASIASTYNSLSVLYGHKDDGQKAIEYSQKAVQYAKKSGNFVAYARYSVSLAMYYTSLANYAEAKPLLDSALQIAKDRGAKNVEASALKTLGVWFAKQGDKAAAIRYFNQSLEILTAIGDASQISDVKASLNILQ